MIQPRSRRARYCANILKENGNNGTDERYCGKASLAKSGHSSVNPSASPTCPEKSRSSHLNFLSVPLFPFAPHSLSLLPKFQQIRGRMGPRGLSSRKRSPPRSSAPAPTGNKIGASPPPHFHPVE